MHPGTNDYILHRGAHRGPNDMRRCAMEWVSHMKGEPKTDRPRGVSPVLCLFGIAINDWLGDAERQRLRQYLPRFVDTDNQPRQDQYRVERLEDVLKRLKMAPANGVPLGDAEPIASVLLKDAIKAINQVNALGEPTTGSWFAQTLNFIDPVHAMTYYVLEDKIPTIGTFSYTTKKRSEFLFEALEDMLPSLEPVPMPVVTPALRELSFA